MIRALPSLAVRTAGSGRPVVLIHGFPSDGRVFAAQLEAAGAGRLDARVIAIDLPGFGRTPAHRAVPHMLGVPALAEAIGASLETVGIERPILGGLAIGAYVAIEYAARHADRIAGLVLIGVKPDPDSPANAERREAVARLALERGPLAVAEQLAEEPFGPGASASARRAFRAMIEEADASGIAALVRGLHRRPDPKPALAQIAARRPPLPALVIVGADDPFTKPADARRLAELLPGSEFQVVAGSGHVLPLEQPSAMNETLARFLARVPDGA